MSIDDCTPSSHQSYVFERGVVRGEMNGFVSGKRYQSILDDINFQLRNFDGNVGALTELGAIRFGFVLSLYNHLEGTYSNYPGVKNELASLREKLNAIKPGSVEISVTE